MIFLNLQIVGADAELCLEEVLPLVVGQPVILIPLTVLLVCTQTEITISVYSSSCNVSLFLLHSGSSAFSFYLIASSRQDGMPRNRIRKKKVRTRQKMK